MALPHQLGNTGAIGTYSRTVDGEKEYALVNKGTGSLEDWIENGKQPFGNSDHMKESIVFATNFVNEHLGASVTMIGHSKGGAEAAANALATDSNAILFNPATLNAGAYGLDSSNYTASMTAHIVTGDILNVVFGLISKPIDKLEWLPMQSLNFITNHTMSAVIEALE